MGDRQERGARIRDRHYRCLVQKEVVTDFQNSCFRELLQEVNVHGKVDRHMRLLKIEMKKQVGHTLGSRRV